MKIWKQFQNLNKAIRWLGYSTFATLVYGAVVGLILPVVLQSVLVDELSENLDRPARLQEIKINPYAMSIRLNGLSISGKHSDELFAFETLIVNFQPLSLFKKEIAFDEIRLVNPRFSIMLLASGDYNFQDLILKFTGNEKPQSTSVKQDENESGWPLVIDKFRYVEGSVYYSDANRSKVFSSQLDDVSISLDDFSTRPGDGNLHHVMAETLRGTKIDWKGEFSLTPLKSKGHVMLQSNLQVVSDYMQDQLLLEINRGKLNVEADYDVAFDGASSKIIVANMTASINGFLALRKDNKSEVLSWDKLSLDLASLDVINKILVVNDVSINGANAGIERDRNTDIDFADLFVLQNISEKNAEKNTASEKKWDIHVLQVSSRNAQIELSDKSVKPTVNHNLQFDLIEFSNLKPLSDEETLFRMDLTLNGKGYIGMQGKVKSVSRLIDLTLDVKSVKLKAYQSYVNDIAHVEILNGMFSSSMKVKVDASSAEPVLTINGGMNVESLKVRDKNLKEEFINWQKLAVNDFVFKYPQQRVDIHSIDIEKPFLRLIMGADGSTNVQGLAIKRASAVAPENKKPVKSESKFQVEINKINIVDGEINFSDNSLKPNFDVGIYGLKGGISGLSSKQLSRANVDLKGKVDKYAPVIIKGKINPLTQDKFTEIGILFKGIELTTFTPYSGKFAGYKIEKGKLSLDLKYKVSKTKLVAENRVILDQLTLGEKTDSEDATSLPVNFALSLLKDSKGKIDFNLPIRGNLDDPDFHYGSLVLGALGNMIVGIVSSPFSALANLVGGDSEGLDYIVFSANNAQLSSAEKIKLDLLAKALIQRPALHIEVKGVSSTLVDHDEMAYIKVRKLLKLKPAALVVTPNENEQEDIVDYYETITQQNADDLLPKKHQLTSQQQSKYIYDKALLVVLNKTQITEKEYRLLAMQRAQKIQKYLIEVGKVSADNVFILDSDTQLENKFEDVENAQLKLPLTLKAI